MYLSESVTMADLTDSALPATQPAASHHLTGDEVLSALKMVCDSLNDHSTSINDLKKDANETGKTFIYIIVHEN